MTDTSEPNATTDNVTTCENCGTVYTFEYVEDLCTQCGWCDWCGQETKYEGHAEDCERL